MSEMDVINKSNKPYTKQDIIRDLKTLGVKKGDCLLVHSSLSKLGWIVGGAVTIVEALVEVVGDTGTLVMPCFSGDNSDPKNWQNPPVPLGWLDVIKENMPAFDPALTPTRGMGVIVNTFRYYPDTLRSNHPQVSFVARGKDAKRLLDNHQLTPGFGKESPLYRLYEKNAKVLLLGVGYENCTCMHLGETWLENPTFESTGASVLIDNKATWVSFQEIAYNDEDFKKIGEAYEKTCVVTKGNIGQGVSRLLEIKSITDFAYEWMKENRKRF